MTDALPAVATWTTEGRWVKVRVVAMILGKKKKYEPPVPTRVGKKKKKTKKSRSLTCREVHGSLHSGKVNRHIQFAVF